ncbi:ATP-grasp ribosomal peptide maturase [Streptomyces sp. 110]|uniref:ATP-grasp ribosomal peptide maturase n=1 Tax=Streptomyces endocoffeicus TaxID=2898945 RepID=A0ABS1Q2F3_9ACTN|nr:ATP-grasp ribosomal peptide maturase [Streptomyces endocoffeicus]MBL1118833.1 ATP-grasp ribosomal peptide maturase [Streptomyces endocoffeicus]
MAHVLVITDEDDRTASRVTSELAVRGVPVARIDATDFPTKLHMSARIGTGATWTGQLVDADTGRELVTLSAVRSVYYRRPTQFTMDQEMNRAERVFAYGEARRGFGGVLQALDGALWVNDPAAAARAEYKPNQLAAAAAVGLNIPRTLITNEPERAYEWAKDLGRPIIYKPLSGIWHADEGKVRIIYTSPVTDLDELRAPALERTAHLFQEQVDKDHEARAIIVGEQVFAVAIDAASEAARTDWRSDYDSLTYRTIDLPGEVAQQLVALHMRLGLRFGAVDLIHDTAGRWVFLETNQSGEWGWLVAKTGIGVADALTDLLIKGYDT